MAIVPNRPMTALIVFVLIASGCSGGASPSDGENPTSTNPPTGSTVTTVVPPTTEASAPNSTVAQDDVVVDACDLLAPAEVAGAIGDQTQEPVFDDSVEGFFTCSYEGAKGNMLVDITVYPDVETAKDFFALGIDMGGNERIEGPGDEAMSTQPLGDIAARVGRIEVTIDMFTEKSLEDELAIAKELAGTIVAQLG